MTPEVYYRWAFSILLLALIGMRVFFMIRVRLAGERLMPDQKAVAREGGQIVLILRMVFFIVLLAFLGMYIARAKWIDAFLIPFPAWLRWLGFGVGLLSIAFWTWTQIVLDTHWSAQLQLRSDHRLITTGPYSRIRHPLYTAMLGWSIALALLTANWIFISIVVVTILGVILRVPKEEGMMVEAFGEEYKAYIEQTGRYFPRLVFKSWLSKP